MRTPLTLLILSFTLLLTMLPTRLLPVTTMEKVAAAPLASSNGPEALPRGCGSVTPPGAELAACCLSGFVYIDGEVVDGAEVTITNAQGERVVLYTQTYSDLPGMAAYRLSLSEPPLNVQAGQPITVTARYSSHEQSVSYTVRPGSQQVDVVLARQTTDDYVVERQIWNPALLGQFNDPTDVAVDQEGNVYVLDAANARVQVFDSTGTPLHSWGSLGTMPGQFFPSFYDAITVDEYGNVYVVEYMLHRIQKFSTEGKLITTWGGRGSNPGQLDYPAGVAVDLDGNVYIANTMSDIHKFSPAGDWIATWQPMEATGGPLWGRMAFGPDGHLYATAWRRDASMFGEYGGVVKMNTSGQLLDTWGFGPGFFGQPRSIAFTPQGNAYLADVRMNVIQLVSNDGSPLDEWTTAQPSGEPLKTPNAVAVAPNGRLYVAERDAHRLLIRGAHGNWVAPWGERGAAQGQLQRPTGITVAPDGSFYVVDRLNHRVQHFSADGTWLRSWGSKGPAPGQFNDPFGIARRGDGTIYVSDIVNRRIDRFTAQGVWLESFDAHPNDWVLPGAIAVNDAGVIHVVEYERDSPGLIYLMNANNELLWQHFDLAFPRSIALAHDNSFYVSLINGVRRYPAGGGAALETLSGLSHARGVAVDSQGHILTTEFSVSRASKLHSDGTLLSRWGEPSDTTTPMTYLSNASLGELYLPEAIAAGPEGRIYVADTRNNRVQIFRPMNYTKPVATITHVSNASLQPGATLTIRGRGQDSHENPQITAYRWTSSQDGVIGNAATLSRAATSLSPGMHRITLEVQNSAGQWSEPVNTTIFVAAPPQVTWTALLYLAGDYPDRSSQFHAFNRALEQLETSLSNPAIRVAAQIDGPADGDTYRVLITPGNPPQVSSISVGEKAMDEPETLSEFIRWGQANFPANHYYLAVANHGQAIQGIAWDRTSDLKDDGVLNYSAYMTTAELGQALRAEGVAPIDVIHLDACSMNLLEVAYELRPRVDVPAQSRLLIASQYLGWNFFAYDTYINAIGINDTPAQVALKVTATYAALGNEAEVPYTIATLDLGRADPMATAVDNLAAELAAHINNDRARLTEVENIWKASPRFDSNGDYLNDDLDDYLDLLAWASRIQMGISNPAVQERAFALIRELSGPRAFIVAGSNRMGSGNLPIRYANGAYINLAAATGVSIFYPGRQDTIAFDNYIDNRIFEFTSATRWPEFLVAGIDVQPPGPRQPLPGPLTGMDLDVADPTPSPTPTASPAPTASPTSTASPAPTASPTSTASPAPTASPTSTASPAPVPTPQQRVFLPLVRR